MAQPVQQAGPSQHQPLTTGKIMTGTRYETSYFVLHGENPGPTAVIVGGLHGDEPAGYLAPETLRKWRVTHGRLVVLPQAHIEAIRRRVRAHPRNMNRLFPGKKNGDAMEKLAFEVWGLIKSSRPDLLLTLHESRNFHALDSKRYGQTFTYDFHSLTPFMRRVAARSNANIPPKLEKFLLFVDPFPTCPTYVATKYLKIPAASIETAKPLSLSKRVHLQQVAIKAFLDEIGLKYSSDKK